MTSSMGKDAGISPPTQKRTKRATIRERIQSKPLVESPPYYFENGFCKVRPYWFEYVVFAKERWYGRRLVDVLEKELFTSFSGFFAKAVKSGRLTVNDQPTSEEYLVENGDLIKHVCHRHELPVLDSVVRILQDTDDLLVVDKPCSMPVHPCGRYHFNSLLLHLKHFHGYENLKTFHRIDRLTSGIVIFLKNATAEKRFRQDLEKKNICKEYVCKVLGEFPSDQVVCTRPLDTLFPSMGLMRVSDKGKPSCTRFQRLHWDGENSIVKCFPVTGRTHQIRVHLQYLGHPIVDDAIYNDPVFGESKGKSGDYGKTLRQLELDVRSRFNIFEHVVPNGVQSEHDCPHCALTPIEPCQSEMKMSLHCLRYSGPTWSFESSLPCWADDVKDMNV